MSWRALDRPNKKWSIYASGTALNCLFVLVNWSTTLKGFFGRAPFVMLGAIGLISLASGMVELQKNLSDWIAAYQFFSHGIWSICLGWLWAWTGWELQDWAKDYLTMGLIYLGMFLRARSYFSDTVLDTSPLEPDAVNMGLTEFFYLEDGYYFWEHLPVRLALILLIWPYSFYRLVILRQEYLEEQNAFKHDRVARRKVFLEVFPQAVAVFFETLVFALIIIAINYGLIAAGAPTS